MNASELKTAILREERKILAEMKPHDIRREVKEAIDDCVKHLILKRFGFELNNFREWRLTGVENAESSIASKLDVEVEAAVSKAIEDLPRVIKNWEKSIHARIRKVYRKAFKEEVERQTRRKAEEDARARVAAAWENGLSKFDVPQATPKKSVKPKDGA